ncbi:hypothetical protein [Klebsiella pneumoniae]|uniref:Uncharacterized protein n=1 Tax=Klebsiella phage vB_KpnM_KpV52 TaxID=1912321 RepID=A0A1I9SEX6_9CAUD|nr:hypothetical protein [Klebsiella pneumoniae]YP_009597587.1 hypothetical protein FDH17_gp59 [Klebsiella phage vB_KpnM_KpV52]AOZ65403.1 hypothetical protein kpv52_59 [Klebsiella phage vB_KpnM_KpV52]MBE9269750.1 hypothetical protein [Klebsiella pneumoniae]
MSNITLTIPNDDHIALRAFGKALEEMALAHGAEPMEETLVRARVGEEEIEYLTRDAVAARLRVATEELQQAAPRMIQELRFEGEELHGKRKEPEVDSTAQQVESLSNKREEFEQIVDDVKVAASEFLNVPSHVLTGQEAPPTIDSTGTPWDERIHSASKALNADGTWRLRRKPKDMDEVEWSDYVSMIKADLQYPVECGGEGEEIGEPTREEVDELIEASNKMLEPHVTPPGDDFHTDAGVVTEQTVAGIPPLPVPPPVVVAPPVPEVTTWDFPRLMTFLTERHGKIDVATVNTLLAQDGMLSVQELNAHPDKIGPFVARVKAHLGE